VSLRDVLLRPARPFLRRQFLLYLAGGVLCALIDVGLMQWLLGRGAAPLAATSAGFGAGLLVNYAFHAKLTFASMAGARSFTRYLCIVALNYLLTLAMVALAQALLGSALAGKLLSLPLVAGNGYLLGKYWIFR
jgi:putative flippase GtrA